MRFRVDLKIFIFLVLFYFTGQIELYGFMMFFAFIHELGHLLAGLFLKMKPEKLELIPFGVTISFRLSVDDYNLKVKNGNLLELKKIIVALAGPVTNLLVILLVFNFCFDFDKCLMIVYTNFLILVFNLLPIFPLDGGRILKGVLHIYSGKRRAMLCVNCVSKVMVVVLTAVSSILILYFQNISIFLIVLYLWFLVVCEDMRCKKILQFTELLKYENY